MSRIGTVIPFGCLLLMLSIPFLAGGQDRFLKRAYDDIRSADLSSARQLIQQYIAKEGSKPEANFLSLQIELQVCTRLDSAEMLISQMGQITSQYASMSERERQQWCKDIQFCMDRFPQISRQIDSLIFTFYSAQKQKELLRRFVEKYPRSAYVHQARTILAHEIFIEAKNLRSAPLLESYLSEFKQMPDLGAAQQLLADIEFEKASGQGSVEALESYIERFPSSTHRQLAQKNIQEMRWRAVVDDPQIQSIQQYLDRYPSAYNYAEALRFLQERSWVSIRNTQQPEPLLTYLQAFPNSPYSDSVRLRLTLLQARPVPYLTAEKTFRLYEPSSQSFQTEIHYDDVKLWPSGHWVVTKEGKQGLLDPAGKEILPVQYQCIGYLRGDQCKVLLDGKWGIMDFTGNYILGLDYQQIIPTEEGDYIVSEFQSGAKIKYGLLDASGKTILGQFFDDLINVRPGVYVGFMQGKKYLIRRDGGGFETGYQDIQMLETGYAIGYLSDRAVLIDSTLRTIISIPYDRVIDLGQDGFLGQQKDHTLQLLSWEGEMRKDLGKSNGKHLGQGLVAIQAIGDDGSTQSEGWRLFDARTGEYVSDQLFEQLGNYRSGLLSAVVSGKLGYLNNKGQFMIAAQFENSIGLRSPFDLFEALPTQVTGAVHAGRAGPNCSSATTPENGGIEAGWKNDPTEFQNGVAAVVYNGKVGFIDPTGKWVVRPQYNRVTPFHHGVSFVVQRRDRKNQLLIITKNDEVLVRDHELVSWSAGSQRLLVRKQTEDFAYDYMELPLNGSPGKVLAKGVDRATIWPSCIEIEQAGYILYQSVEGTRFVDKELDMRDRLSTRYISLGNRFRIQNNAARAEYFYRKAIDINPRSLSGWLALAKLREESEQWDQALSIYDQLITDSISLPDGYQGQINVHLRRSNWSAAIIAYNNLLTTGVADSARVYLGLAACQIQWGMVDAAIQAYSQYIRLTPESSIGYNNRGHCYLTQRQFTKALSDFSTAIRWSGPQTDVRRSIYFNNRGIAQLALDNRNAACEDFRRAVELGSIEAITSQNTYCR